VLDAKTGAYQRHFQLVKHDFHDWDASMAPVLFTSRQAWPVEHAPSRIPCRNNSLSATQAHRLIETGRSVEEHPVISRPTRLCQVQKTG